MIFCVGAVKHNKLIIGLLCFNTSTNMYFKTSFNMLYTLLKSSNDYADLFVSDGKIKCIDCPIDKLPTYTEDGKPCGSTEIYRVIPDAMADNKYSVWKPAKYKVIGGAGDGTSVWKPLEPNIDVLSKEALIAVAKSPSKSICNYVITKDGVLRKKARIKG